MRVRWRRGNEERQGSQERRGRAGSTVERDGGFREVNLTASGRLYRCWDDGASEGTPGNVGLAEHSREDTYTNEAWKKGMDGRCKGPAGLPCPVQ